MAKLNETKLRNVISDGAVASLNGFPYDNVEIIDRGGKDFIWFSLINDARKDVLFELNSFLTGTIQPNGSVSTTDIEGKVKVVSLYEKKIVNLS